MWKKMFNVKILYKHVYGLTHEKNTHYIKYLWFYSKICLIKIKMETKKKFEIKLQQ